MVGDPDDGSGLALPLAEEFYSIQGEGANSGKAAYFIRIAGCDVGCCWCDTKYSWNPGDFPMVAIETIISNVVSSGADSVVITGGEPLMWDLGPLTRLLKEQGMATFLETSGAFSLTGRWDWITLSPKKGRPPVEEIWGVADELKVIIEDGTDFEEAEKYSGRVQSDCRLLLQPEWNCYNEIIPLITEYVKRNVRWRVSLQTHKFMHIP